MDAWRLPRLESRDLHTWIGLDWIDFLDDGMDVKRKDGRRWTDFDR